MIRSAFGMQSVVRIERAESFFAPRNVAKNHTHTENTGTCIAVLEGHLGAVYGCSFSPNSRFAASGSWDKTIKIWDLPKKECVLTLKGHQGRVYSVAFSPCGTKVLSASKDKTLKLWDVSAEYESDESEERCICTLEGHSRRVLHCSFSPRSFLAASASADMTVRVWDTVMATCVFVLTGTNIITLSYF